ncbi:hypothetical protein B0A49_08802 [Cryomyces minteri]|uniref:DRBM domain-containing protein n=1 Tax=Cryomyces minteri TaxID=331657 RepID=A0A4U0X8N0_9PEZI|nr:hypothetical protein B0A49_08802 [Cryomyces minteri]
MFYIMYLTGLCHRRHWPDPLFDTYRTRHGYQCTVRVNNREYTTDTGYESDELARNAAATRAYMICRNFSVNDGMFPGHRPGQGGNGVVQGLPVAIGAGRRSTYTTTSSDYESGGSIYAEVESGGSSPRSSEHDAGNERKRRSRPDPQLSPTSSDSPSSLKYEASYLPREAARDARVP